MSKAHGTLEQAATSPHPHARESLAGVSGPQPGGSSYVGMHRRRDAQGPDLDPARRRPPHRPRHRRIA